MVKKIFKKQLSFWRIYFSSTILFVSFLLLLLPLLFSYNAKKNAVIINNQNSNNFEKNNVSLNQQLNSVFSHANSLEGLHLKNNNLLYDNFAIKQASNTKTESANNNNCSNNIKSDSVVKILATTTIIADLLRQIGKKEVCVTSLMGVGVDPHSYVARESDVRQLLQADAIFYHGLNLEAKMTETFEAMYVSGMKKVYNISSTIPKSWLINVNAENAVSGKNVYYDPHVWFDVRIWTKAVEVVKLGLQGLKPEQKAFFEKQANLYLQKLAYLNMHVKQQLETVQSKYLITSHDAFSYLGRAYGIEVVALKGINTQTQSGIKDMNRLVRFVVKNNVPAIFTENSMSKKEMETIALAAKAKGHVLKIGNSLFTDALGSRKTGLHTYEAVLLYNVHTMVQFLGRRMQEKLAEKIPVETSVASSNTVF